MPRSRVLEGSPLTPKDAIHGKIALSIAVILTLIGTYWYFADTSWMNEISDPAQLQQRVENLGLLGPFAIIGLMALAIVFTPIPSAPIALTAGALYGHAWGTLYIVTGAETGALMAFALARFLGYRFIHRRFGERLDILPHRSQWVLMAIVFASRLLPFLSFDIVSYAAGLTPLKAWRFALATLLGILPASFVLAHFGGELSSGDPYRLAITGLLVGVIVLIPILWRVLTRKRAP